MSRDPKSGNFGVASLAALGGLAASGIAYVGLSEVSKQFREGTYSVSQKGGPLGKILMGADGFSQMVFGHYAGGGRNLNGLRVNGEFGSGRWNLRQGSLRNASVQDATFASLDLRRSDWTGATLRNVKFKQCDLTGAQMQGAEFHENVTFEDCWLMLRPDRRSTLGSAATAVLLEPFLYTALPKECSGVRFSKCDLSGRNFESFNLRSAKFHECLMVRTNFESADMGGVEVTKCDATKARFDSASLRSSSIIDTDLTDASFRRVDLEGASIERCDIYGISLWGTRGEPNKARSLQIYDRSGGRIEIDGLHVAVFLESLLNGGGVRDLVDGVASSLVLILGRFNRPNKDALDELRVQLRASGYAAILFDSSVPRHRDTTETIGVLGRLSRFVIADVTDPQSSPYELVQFVHDCRVPTQVVVRGQKPFSMSADLEKYPWVLPARQFEDTDALIAELPCIVSELEQLRSRVHR